MFRSSRIPQRLAPWSQNDGASLRDIMQAPGHVIRTCRPGAVRPHRYARGAERRQCVGTSGRKAHSGRMTGSYDRGGSVSTGASREHIERALVGYGATDVRFSQRGDQSAIAFRGDGRQFRLVVSLPQSAGTPSIPGDTAEGPLRAAQAKIHERATRKFGTPWPWQSTPSSARSRQAPPPFSRNSWPTWCSPGTAPYSTNRNRSSPRRIGPAGILRSVRRTRLGRLQNCASPGTPRTRAGWQSPARGRRSSFKTCRLRVWAES